MMSSIGSLLSCQAAHCGAPWHCEASQSVIEKRLLSVWIAACAEEEASARGQGRRKDTRSTGHGALAGAVNLQLGSPFSGAVPGLAMGTWITAG